MQWVSVVGQNVISEFQKGSNVLITTVANTNRQKNLGNMTDHFEATPRWPKINLWRDLGKSLCNSKKE